MIDILKGEINFLKSAWQNLLGRPLVTLVLKSVHLGRFQIQQKRKKIFSFSFCEPIFLDIFWLKSKVHHVRPLVASPIECNFLCFSTFTSFRFGFWLTIAKFICFISTNLIMSLHFQ